jgi:deoxyribodipyrimidine photo-lyase
MCNVFLFHRDLRLVDHRPLQHCLSLKHPVVPLFVFDPQQVDPGVEVRSVKSLACLFQSLEELDRGLSSGLCLAYGDVCGVLGSLHKKTRIHHVVETRDYTPFALRRQERVAQWCGQNRVGHVLMDDLYFFPPGTVRNRSGRVFQKFTPFYHHISRMDIPPPLGRVRGRFLRATTPYAVSLRGLFKRLCPGSPGWKGERRKYQGGREEGLWLLRHLPRDYDTSGSWEKSGLSVHHHYGTISVRESYARAGRLGLEGFQRQLFWREFYGNLMAFFQELYHTDPLAFQSPPRLSKEKKKVLDAWCRGETGVPILDAAMNQLNEEGFMPNRLRMIVASWLVKDMGVPWRYGERYFANHLLDYDLTQNMMNWVWVASVLPFASAPFRRFSTDFPPDHPYLRAWLLPQ